MNQAENSTIYLRKRWIGFSSKFYDEGNWGYPQFDWGLTKAIVLRRATQHRHQLMHPRQRTQPVWTPAEDWMDDYGRIQHKEEDTTTHQEAIR